MSVNTRRLIFAVFVCLLFLAIYMAAKMNSFTVNRSIISSGFVSLTPTSTARLEFTPTPVSAETRKTANVDLDQTVLCNFTNLPDKRMTESECKKTFECQIGSQWFLYTDINKCKEDQNKNVKVADTSKSAPTTQTGYPCTICYGSANCYTYNYLYKTKEACDAAQPVNSASTNPPVVHPSVIPSPTPKISYENYEFWCESQINPKYDSLVRNCSVELGAMGAGDSSAVRVCENAQNQERAKEINACLQQYVW